jgi:hypothetical protein
MKNSTFIRNAILSLVFGIPFSLSAQRDTTKAITLDPSWIIYCSHDLFFDKRYNPQNNEFENYFADYGITAGIHKRASFNNKVGMRFGLNYVTNRIKYNPTHSNQMTFVRNGQPVVIKYISSNFIQIPWFLEFKFLNKKNLEIYAAAGLAFSFQIEGGIAEEKLIVEQNGKQFKLDNARPSPSHSMYSFLNHHLALGINYKLNNKIAFNLEPTLQIKTLNEQSYYPIYLGIATNIIYRFK